MTCYANYDIITLSYDNPNDYLVIAKTSINPISELIHTKIPFLKNGKIVIDLTAINGLKAHNRYVTASVENRQIRLDSLTASPDIDTECRNLSINYFKSTGILSQTNAALCS